MPTARNQGIDIHYDVRGGGPPVVLLHSFLCSGRMWEHQVEPLAERCRVINVDLRGHGRSGVVVRPLTLDDLVDDALAVLDREGIERAAWAGLSIGGMIALRAALRSPERVSSLLLLDTDAGPEKRATRLKYRVLGWIARTFGLGPVLPRIARLMFGPTTHRERAELVAEWTEIFGSVHVPSILLMLEPLVARDDLRPRLGEIDAPALVLVGSEDRSLPPERSRALAAQLPRAELVEIEGAGHLSALERPAEVTAAMTRFLGARESA